MWDKTFVEKEVLEFTQVEETFEYKGDKYISRVVKSCGCTKAKKEDNKVILTINTDPVKSKVHKRLYDQGKRDYFKKVSVDVVFNDGSVDKLTLNLHVLEQNVEVQ